MGMPWSVFGMGRVVWVLSTCLSPASCHSLWVSLSGVTAYFWSEHSQVWPELDIFLINKNYIFIRQNVILSKKPSLTSIYTIKRCPKTLSIINNPDLFCLFHYCLFFKLNEYLHFIILIFVTWYTCTFPPFFVQELIKFVQNCYLSYYFTNL